MKLCPEIKFKGQGKGRGAGFVVGLGHWAKSSAITLPFSPNWPPNPNPDQGLFSLFESDKPVMKDCYEIPNCRNIFVDLIFAFFDERRWQDAR